MTNLTRVLVLAGVVTLTNVHGSVTGTANHLLAAEAGKAPVNYAVSANNDFAIDLYKQLATEKQGENLFFSPYSISNALAMTAEGARGETAAQMGKALCFPTAARRIGSDAQLIPWNVALIHTGYAELNQRFNASKRSYELRVANALWGEMTHPFLQAYVDTIHEYYKTGGLFTVDFRGDPEAVRLRINEWVEQQTANKIKDLIAEGQIDSSTRLVLTNAIYFKGKWQNVFMKSNTRQRDFSVSATKKIKTPQMFQEDNLRYSEYASLKVLELPYKGRDLSMLILLPSGIDGLPALEKSLSAERIGKLRSKLRPRRVEVYLPKFRLEMAFELKPALEALGMKQAFTGAADFSGIDGEHYLSISAVIHKTFVDVNEVGTEAAAATAVILGRGTGMPPRVPPAVFRADHPFLFMICDRWSGSILFLGRVINPRK